MRVFFNRFDVAVDGASVYRKTNKHFLSLRLDGTHCKTLSNGDSVSGGTGLCKASLRSVLVHQ